jgi:hypothetical protein
MAASVSIEDGGTMIYEFEHFLLEHGFARVMRILWGDVPNVQQIGILTANNPNYRQLPQAENDERNRSLMHQLRASNYGPIKIKGKFTGATTGREEDSFLVPHISREAILSLGQHFGQGDVIWGQKKADEEGNPYFDFEWINCETGFTTQHRYVAMSGGGIPARADAYSKARARKFVIPFWDDPYKDYLPGGKRGTVEQPSHIAALRPSARDRSADQWKSSLQTLLQAARAESIEPNVTLEVVRVEHGGGDVLLSEKLPHTTDVTTLVEEIRAEEEFLYDPNVTGKRHWIARGTVGMAIENIQTLLHSKGRNT